MRNPSIALMERKLRHVSDVKKRRFFEIPGIKEQFEAQRAQIEALLAQTWCYHGTGAKHYLHQGESKYDGIIDEVGDSLGSFLSEGLKPRHDMYNQLLQTGADNSISLSENRMYARLYAELFLYENDELAYMYGPRPFWWRLTGVKSVRLQTQAILHMPIVELMKSLKRINPREKQTMKGKVKLWTGSIRKDGKYKDDPFGAMSRAKSDIESNFPIIIGVREDSFKPLPIKFTVMRAYEKRSSEVISSEQFSHLQVPLSKVDAVRQRVQELGLDLPIVPIEFVELIQSEMPLEEVSKPAI